MIDPTTNRRVYMIDASLLVQSDCLRKVDYIHNKGLTTLEKTFKMDYGNGFHRFRASFRTNGNSSEARKKALDYFLPKCMSVPFEDFRTIDHLHETCKLYVEKYRNDILKPLVIKDKLCLEFSFCFPYISTPFYDILLTGTIDEVGNLCGRDCIVDCKVTALWKKEDFFKNFELDPQMRFYSWILKYMGITNEYLPGVIDGVFIKKPTEKVKNKLTGKLEIAKEWNGASFERSHIIEYSEESMLEFEQWLKWKLDTIIEAHEKSNWRPNFNCCNDVFGACEFKELCMKYKLEEHYAKRDYNPLNFQA